MTLPHFDIQPVALEEILPLRTRVLRPAWSDGKTLRYAGDDAPDACHFAAVVSGEAIACATFVFEKTPEDVGQFLEGTDAVSSLPRKRESSQTPMDSRLRGNDKEGQGTSIRLRGMAVEPRFQKSGVGSVLLLYGLDAMRSLGANVVWCSARTGVLPFYERHGFIVTGEAFDIPDAGPHRYAHRTL